MPVYSRTAVFQSIKQVLRNHKDWTDEQVIENLGLKLPEFDLIATARRDLEAG